MTDLAVAIQYVDRLTAGLLASDPDDAEGLRRGLEERALAVERLVRVLENLPAPPPGSAPPGSRRLPGARRTSGVAPGHSPSGHLRRARSAGQAAPHGRRNPALHLLPRALPPPAGIAQCGALWGRMESCGGLATPPFRADCQSPRSLPSRHKCHPRPWRTPPACRVPTLGDAPSRPSRLVSRAPGGRRSTAARAPARRRPPVSSPARRR